MHPLRTLKMIITMKVMMMIMISVQMMKMLKTVNSDCPEIMIPPINIDKHNVDIALLSHC